MAGRRRRTGSEIRGSIGWRRWVCLPGVLVLSSSHIKSHGALVYNLRLFLHDLYDPVPPPPPQLPPSSVVLLAVFERLSIMGYLGFIFGSSSRVSAPSRSAVRGHGR